MKTYRFLGVKASIPDASPTEVSSFGAQVDIPESRLAEALGNGAQVIPEDMFWKIFTPADMEPRNAKATALHELMGDAFLAKRKASWIALHDFRESVLNPGVPAPVVAAQEEVNHADVL